MFKVVTMPTFKRPVEISVPSDNGHEKQTLTATYKALAAEEADKFDLSTQSGSAEFLRAVIVKLDDVVGENNEVLPYSDNLRDQIIAMPYARMPLARAYMEAVGGAKAGN
jgi:hypothetical protein